MTNRSSAQTRLAKELHKEIGLPHATCLNVVKTVAEKTKDPDVRRRLARVELRSVLDQRDRSEKYVDTSGRPGTWRQPDRDIPLPFSEALEVWTDAAILILQDVASRFGGYITYRQFADRLFEETGICTRMRLGSWIGKPLGAVLEHCHAHGLPALSALVVHTHDGMVGEGFSEFLRLKDRVYLDDPLQLEWVAAQERLSCYRIFCLDVPVDAAPMLTREYARRLEQGSPAPQLLPNVCPSCGMALSPSQKCKWCD